MKYKHTTLNIALCLLMGIQGRAQIIRTPANSVLIQKGATLHMDGLSLTATDNDFTFNENALETATQPIVGTPKASIARAYGFYNAITFTGEVRMKYLPSELNGNAETDLQLTFAGPDLKFAIPTNLTNVNYNTQTLTENVTDKTFQYITATSSGSALPVMLIDFKAASTEINNVLTWSTSRETNSGFFEIQHSTDGKQWNEVGRVTAEGESIMVRNYKFEHTNPVRGDNFYRLKMVDQDGTFAYSRVRSAKFDGLGGLAFHPNPVSDVLRMKAADWSTFKIIRISNVAGVVVTELDEQQIKNLPEKEIDVRKLPSGIYLVHITHLDGTVDVGKVFKN